MSPVEGEGRRKSPSPGSRRSRLKFQLALGSGLQLNPCLLSNPRIALARATRRIERDREWELCQGFETGNALERQFLALQFGGPSNKRKMIIAAPLASHSFHHRQISQ